MNIYPTLLVPLGLLGLLGIVALIIIYLIKPNYQIKHISSTYVWELSLRYRKKRIPTSPLRNILIFLCELLALALIAIILAQLVVVHENRTEKQNAIAVIDSSASMYAETEGETRFQRAIGEAIVLSQEVFSKNGSMSVIIADGDPYYLMREVPAAKGYELIDALEALSKQNDCFYGTSDIKKAMTLCEEVVANDPSAEVTLFTDTEYSNIKEVNVVNVGEDDEWNAGILSAVTEIEDGHQVLTVTFASYGRAAELAVRAEVTGANAINSEEAGRSISLRTERPVYCNAGEVQTVIFKTITDERNEGNIYYEELVGDQIFATYRSIHIALEVVTGEKDSYALDDSFEIFGGQKHLLKVQYASSRRLPAYEGDMENPGPNPFVNGALGMVKNALSDRWDISVTEIAPGREPALTGFDIYIFEHDMPEEIPTDGVVFLLDPPIGWVGGGIEVIDIKDMNRVSVSLMENPEESEHPVLHDPNGFNVKADYITVSRYKVITCDTDDFEVLMTCDTDPALMVRKNGAEQVAVMSFSVHYSNVGRINEMSYLFYNLFDYYFPGIVNKNAFEVGEELIFGNRGPEAEITSSGVTGTREPITDLPASLTMDTPGSYTVSQKLYFAAEGETEGKTLSENIFVRCPAYESDIRRTDFSELKVNRPEEQDAIIDDLLIYLAAALTALLFIEWILHAKEEGK